MQKHKIGDCETCFYTTNRNGLKLADFYNSYYTKTSGGVCPRQTKFLFMGDEIHLKMNRPTEIVCIESVPWGISVDFFMMKSLNVE